VLTNPGIHVSTREIFARLKRDQWSSGETTLSMADALREGGAAPAATNVLQKPLFELYPAARACFREVQRRAHGRVFISGSGPTVVSQWPDREAAEAACVRFSALGYWNRVVRNCATEERELPCRA
jgi:4-diphosphocytidyl-2C-methyl-D-erythritol kinase